MGKVTAIDGVKVTLMGSIDNAAHSFVADENTTFRKRRDPVTLADIQVGDNVARGRGAQSWNLYRNRGQVMAMPREERLTSPATRRLRSNWGAFFSKNGWEKSAIQAVAPFTTAVLRRSLEVLDIGSCGNFELGTDRPSAAGPPARSRP